MTVIKDIFKRTKTFATNKMWSEFKFSVIYFNNSCAGGVFFDPNCNAQRRRCAGVHMRLWSKSGKITFFHLNYKLHCSSYIWLLVAVWFEYTIFLIIYFMLFAQVLMSHLLFYSGRNFYTSFLFLYIVLDNFNHLHFIIIICCGHGL